MIIYFSLVTANINDNPSSSSGDDNNDCYFCKVIIISTTINKTIVTISIYWILFIALQN